MDSDREMEAPMTTLTTLEPIQVLVNGKAYAWTPEGGLDPEAVRALDVFIKREAWRTAKAYSKLGVDADDLAQEARLAALAAARRYDPTRGASFLTYAAFSIRSGMEIGTRALVAGRQAGRRAVVCSFDGPLDQDEEGGAEVAEPMVEPEAFDHVEATEKQHRLAALLARLGRRDRRVLELRLGLAGGPALDSESVAAQLGLTRAQVDGCVRRAIEMGTGQASRRVA